MNAISSRTIQVCLLSALLLAMSGCQAQMFSSKPPTQPPAQPPNPQPPAPPAISVSIAPSSPSIDVGAKLQFTATVSGTSNTAVTWSSDSVAGGNSGAGMIDSSGLYAAPAQTGTHTVTATSVADTTKSASVTVTVVNSSSVSPNSATLIAGATQQFRANFPGLTNPTIAWLVDGISGGNDSVGTISSSGLYAAPSQPGNHTVSASAGGAQVGTTAQVTVFTLSLSPGAIAVAASGTHQFSADVAGLTNTAVQWSVDGVQGGNGSAGTITASGLYKAPFAVGPHKITAASAANPSATVAAYVTVINSSPGAVVTYHNDDERDGTFTEETTLTPSNVNSSQFGKLASYPVDGQIYAQPLYVPQLTIKGATHNVVFAATQNDTVYAFDGDAQLTSPLWSKSLGIPSPRNDAEGVSPELGILSTPVIDITTKTMYVLATTANGPFVLHALDITTGAEKFGGPVSVTGSVSGSGWDNSGGTIQLEGGCYQRMGLALNPVTNDIYLGFGHCSHGWLLAYDKTSLKQTAIFNDTPDGAGGGLWAGGGAPAIDDLSGDVYLMTGVDADDPSSGYNDSFLRLSADDLSEKDYFQPANESWLDANDADLGSGGTILLPDNSSGTPHQVVGGGKDGRVFLVNRDNMGAFSASGNNVIQTLQVGQLQFDNIFSTPVYWNGFLYYHCHHDVLKAYGWSNGHLSSQPVSSAGHVYDAHGATASLSSNGNANGIIWDIDNTSDGNGPAVLHAYDATNVGKELYNSSQAGSRDTAGTALRFTVPTIAGGKVYVGTRNELDVYGLLNH